MNPFKIRELYGQNLISDLTVVLFDDTDTLTLNVHKVILYCGAPYFEKLIQNMAPDTNVVKITVPDVYVTRDIIMSFYHMTTNDAEYDSIYLLMEQICRDFLCLHLNPVRLNNVVIPSEGLPLLIQLIELTNYSPEYIKILYLNITEQSDQTQLSPRIKTELQKIKRALFYHYLCLISEVNVVGF